MAWELLPVDYTDASWSGLKRYNEINNADGTVSFQDVTLYTGKEKSFFGARDANRMNEALNTIMSMVENGTDLYGAFQAYFNTQKALFENEYHSYLDTMQAEGDAELEKIKTEYKSEIQTFETQQEALFNQWFDFIKGQLGTDVAGNLQNQINTLNTKVSDIEADMPNAGGSRFKINFTFDTAGGEVYSNCKYKLTVGETVRQGDFSTDKLTVEENGILTVGTARLDVSYDFTIDGSKDSKSLSMSVDVPYYGAFVFNAQVSVNFDYKKWLATIGKSAASLDAVLADEKLVRELMTRHISSDYLAKNCKREKDIQPFTNSRVAVKWVGLRKYIYDKLMAIPAWKTALQASAYKSYIATAPTDTSEWEFGNDKIYMIYDNGVELKDIVYTNNAGAIIDPRKQDEFVLETKSRATHNMSVDGTYETLNCLADVQIIISSSSPYGMIAIGGTASIVAHAYFGAKTYKETKKLSLNVSSVSNGLSAFVNADCERINVKQFYLIKK